MRHKYAGYKLKRPVDSRNALLRNLTTSVIENERIVTTVPKAKAVRPWVEKMITLAKEDTLHSRRQAAMILRTPASVKKLFDTLGTRFGQRNGGYTRITKLGPRKGDGAEQAMLELVGSELVKRAAERAKRKEAKLEAQRQGREHEEEGPEEYSSAAACKPSTRRCPIRARRRSPSRRRMRRRSPRRSSRCSRWRFRNRCRDDSRMSPPRSGYW
jgi:large subunit ribosomal protein L17